LGTPNNGLVTNALSLPNCWGSNLKGVPASYVDTSLISPAIYLTNGNLATLTFWHAYDFTASSASGIEQGEVQIVVDNGSTLVPLRDFTDFSDGWEQAQIDLTPYVGQVIYLVWEYALLSFDSSSAQRCDAARTDIRPRHGGRRPRHHRAAPHRRPLPSAA